MKKTRRIFGLLILCLALFAASFSASAETEEHRVWTTVTKFLGAVKKSDVNAANKCFTKSVFSRRSPGSYYSRYMAILRKHMSYQVNAIKLKGKNKATASVTVKYYSMKKSYLAIYNYVYFNGGDLDFTVTKSLDSYIRQTVKKNPAKKRSRKFNLYLVKSSGAWKLDQKNGGNADLAYDVPYLDWYDAYDEFADQIPSVASQNE